MARRGNFADYEKCQMNLYLFYVVVNLVFWAFRSLHEKFDAHEISRIDYFFGFALCFVPIANIATGIFFVQYGIGNIRGGLNSEVQHLIA